MLIDIKDDRVVIDGVTFLRQGAAPAKVSPALADELNKYHGACEYDTTVAKMIRWFYGYDCKVSWCAIAVSYICNELGCLDAIGGKNDNVNKMRNACIKAASNGYGQYFIKSEIPLQIKKNDILFFLWEGKEMTDNSSKHVCIAEFDTKADMLYCIGGNQKDKVCTLEYKRSQLYGVYRIGG